MRALNQADSFFEHCEVPGEFLVVPPGPNYTLTFNSFVTSGNTSVGNLALGVARAAYDEGLAYAKERKQGGKPIIEHQIVAKRLFDSFRKIEAADLLLQKSSWLISQQRPRTELNFRGSRAGLRSPRPSQPRHDAAARRQRHHQGVPHRKALPRCRPAPHHGRHG